MNRLYQMKTTFNVRNLFEKHCPSCSLEFVQGRTDHLETQALPEGPGSVGGP
ncbi:unnamed protein product [Staurois parvus]|uniref:Uncharacterized protein n=1 Tax=Staurois parvus TaxID=386267 RepID=A0ABN9C5A6_9NEOB|nr:unnamed protein product [Staurois parvus]